MSVIARYDSVHQLYEIQLSGVLRHEEFTAHQADVARHIEAGHAPRVLVVVGDFQGWERGADWQNLDFLFSYGDQIAKIAFVGDKQWEDSFKLFTGAGYRATPVGYFETGREEIARAWLLG
jgi:hypothetical protein